MESTPTLDWVSVASTPLSSAELTTWATRANCGAVVTFCGVVRDNSHDLENVEALEYETDVHLAEGRIADVIAEARIRWPHLGAVAIHHRMGRVELSEPAVVIVVSAPHRGPAFEAAAFCIDAVKSCVPMWKRELWRGGSAWSEEGRAIMKVQDIPSFEAGPPISSASTQ
ncbi:MAG: molybdenum cofactor biosynthesis protein MoaE [Acidimicrobiales bacterium]